MTIKVYRDGKQVESKPLWAMMDDHDWAVPVVIECLYKNGALTDADIAAILQKSLHEGGKGIAPGYGIEIEVEETCG